MLFVALLIAATSAIAFSAAFFSVYGLAHTFSGVFWSVVVMGGSLEAGKLVAASYLYRYWDTTNRLLRWYLLAGVGGLMITTSIGIFGYMSAGYQQDVLPLKQKNEQITLLTDEKTRAMERKRQIDDILAGGPAVTSVNNTKGEIDKNAAKTLRETTRARESLGRQYKAEQEAATQRVAELDKQLLALKQDIIQTEAHIGPITYIAKAVGLESDDATKYLIFLIIITFDPMAVALTLAVNNVLRLREEERKSQQQAPALQPEPAKPVKQGLEMERGLVTDHVSYEDDVVPEPELAPESVTEPELTLAPVEEPETTPQPVFEDPVHITEVEPEPESVPVSDAVDPTPVPTPVGPARRPRSFTNLTVTNDSAGSAKLRELMDHYKYLKQKEAGGDQLSRDERWEQSAIYEVLRKHGVDIYL